MVKFSSPGYHDQPLGGGRWADSRGLRNLVQSHAEHGVSDVQAFPMALEPGQLTNSALK